MDELRPDEVQHARAWGRAGSVGDVAIKYTLALAVAVITGFVLRWWLG